jgi:aminoglycoside phosphotransferase (APT) family kinase protein
MREDVLALVNERLRCAQCGETGRWTATGRPEKRQLSIIHRMRCGRCGEAVVAKAVSSDGFGKDAVMHGRKEYETLRGLQHAFPPEGSYGILVPVDYLEWPGGGVMITRWSSGTNLQHYVRALDPASVGTAFEAVGGWLRKLHHSDGASHQACPLDVGDKLEYLSGMYGEILLRREATLGAFQLLQDAAARVARLPATKVRLHGDFKPANMLWDGARCIGIDIHYTIVGAAAYDLAPFLNHLWIDAGGVRGSRTGQLRNIAEASFLAGYGYSGDPLALRWAQLYFALHYLGDHSRRGALRGGYARWQLRSLVKQLVQQVRNAV